MKDDAIKMNKILLKEHVLLSSFYLGWLLCLLLFLVEK